MGPVKQELDGLVYKRESTLFRAPGDGGPSPKAVASLISTGKQTSRSVTQRSREGAGEACAHLGGPGHVHRAWEPLRTEAAAEQSPETEGPRPGETLVGSGGVGERKDKRGCGGVRPGKARSGGPGTVHLGICTLQVLRILFIRCMGSPHRRCW